MARRGFLPSGQQKTLSAGDQKVLTIARREIQTEVERLERLISDERAAAAEKDRTFTEAAASARAVICELREQLERAGAFSGATRVMLIDEARARKAGDEATITAWLRRTFAAARRFMTQPIRLGGAS